MKLRHVFSYALAITLLGFAAGCALLSPVPTDPAHAQLQQQAIKQQAQQLADTVNAANAVIAQLKAVKESTPTTPTTSPTTIPAGPSVNPPAAPGTSTKTADDLINLLTTQVQNLNTQIQNAPNVEAQKQAAFDAGVKTAQAAAVTFGGPYGNLIVAGIGIVSVLLQGIFNSKKAHDVATQAQTTTNNAVGAMITAGLGRPANA